MKTERSREVGEIWVYPQTRAYYLRVSDRWCYRTWYEEGRSELLPMAGWDDLGYPKRNTQPKIVGEEWK